MDIKILIASVVGLSAVGAGGYFVVTNNISVEVNQPSEGSGSTIVTDDFRKLIPNYDSLSVWDKARAINEVYDVLQADQKIAAKQELSALGEEANRKALENVGTSKSEGYTPQGWDN